MSDREADAYRPRRRALRSTLHRHAFKVWVAAALVIALAIYGACWLSWRSSHVSSDDARVGGRLIDVASRVDGWLTKRPVIEGDHIQKGQVLAVLDKRQAHLRLDDLQARIDADTARIQQYRTQRKTTRDTTDAGVQDAAARVTAARASVAQARHQEQLARLDFKRIDRLLKAGDVSQQDWDKAHTALIRERDALHQAQARLKAQQAALTNARAKGGQVDVLSEQIKVARQQRKSLMVQADQVRQELADRTLKSPIDGVVDKTLVNQGDYVQAGQWMMMIHDPNDLWVEANIKETAIGAVKPGQPVTIHVDAFPNLTLRGKVLRVGDAATSEFALLPSPNPSGSFTKITQRVPVRIALDHPDPHLKPGLMAEVSIDVSH